MPACIICYWLATLLDGKWEGGSRDLRGKDYPIPLIHVEKNGFFDYNYNF